MCSTWKNCVLLSSTANIINLHVANSTLNPTEQCRWLVRSKWTKCWVIFSVRGSSIALSVISIDRNLTLISVYEERIWQRFLYHLMQACCSHHFSAQCWIYNDNSNSANFVVLIWFPVFVLMMPILPISSVPMSLQPNWPPSSITSPDNHKYASILKYPAPIPKTPFGLSACDVIYTLFHPSKIVGIV